MYLHIYFNIHKKLSWLTVKNILFFINPKTISFMHQLGSYVEIACLTFWLSCRKRNVKGSHLKKIQSYHI